MFDRFRQLTAQRATPGVEFVESEPTPIYIGQRMRLIMLAAIALGIFILAREAPSIPRLLLLGATVALVLSFPVRLLSGFMPRGPAILIVIGSTVLLTIVGLGLAIPFAVSEISQFVTQLPETAESIQNLVRDILVEFNRRGWMNQNPDVVIEDFQASLFDRGEMIAENVLTNVLGTLTRTFSILITTFGVIFIATYLLIDIPRFKEKFVLSFSPAYRPDAVHLWTTIGESLSRYLAGLLLSIAIQGSMATLGLALLGIPYALVLGLWMSVTAILPYVGAFLGAIPSVLIALTISWQMALAVAGLYVVINQIEGNLITPRVQGEAVRVHPLLIFISVIGGSEIAGFLGAVLAVPTLAVLRVFAEFLWVRLRIRQPQDTVLVALGGEDDGASFEEVEEMIETEEAAMELAHHGNVPKRAAPPRSGGTAQTPGAKSMETTEQRVRTVNGAVAQVRVATSEQDTTPAPNGRTTRTPARGATAALANGRSADGIVSVRVNRPALAARRRQHPRIRRHTIVPG
jgi:predicted PurR-regulated permease PerM